MAINDLASADALRVAGLETKIRNAQAALAADQMALSAPRNQNASAQSILRNAIAQQEEVIADLQAQLAVAQTAAAASQTAAAQPTASAADITVQSQLARDDNANTKAAPPIQYIETPEGRIVSRTTVATNVGSDSSSVPSTNAILPNTIANGNVDAGTNANTVTLTNSQAIPSPLPSGALSNPPFLDPAQAAKFNQLQASGAITGSTPINNATQGGVGAGSDDAAQPTTNTTRNRLDELYAGAANAIIAQDNILDNYASYTYSLSWYLVDPDTYNKLIKSPKRNLEGYYLLVQSGGAPVNNQVPVNNGTNPTVPTAGTVGYGRSPFFPLDYYLDNFEFGINYAGGLESGGPATFTTVSFSVTEPNGITLLDNLFAAVSDLYQKKSIVSPGVVPNYIAATFVMVVRFYGYDVNGDLVQPIARRVGSTDNQAAVEKFIPFVIKDINFRVANKLVEYQITGTGVSTNTAFSTDRGSIPQNFQFQGATVKEILVGTVVQQTASAAAGDQTRNGVPIQDTPPGTTANTIRKFESGQGQQSGQQLIANNGWGEG
jgi:hypothetical protein